SLRAASAGALQLRADDLRRHHGSRRREARGDGGDGVAGLSAAVLRRARAASRESRAAHLGAQRDPVRRGVPARAPPGGASAVSAYDELARLGTATVYEAAGREGLVDEELVRVVPGSRA